MGAHEGRREGLGGQIRRNLGVSDTGEEIAEHLILVAAIEDPEGTGLRARCREQSLVRRVVPHR